MSPPVYHPMRWCQRCEVGETGMRTCWFCHSREYVSEHDPRLPRRSPLVLPTFDEAFPWAGFVPPLL